MEDEDLKIIQDGFDKIKRRGRESITRHFDRIHDKLFAFNNIMIVGYFALSKLNVSISMFNILIPLCNLVILIIIEFRMMEKGRFEAKIMDKTDCELDKYKKGIDRTNLYSLLTITASFIVTLIFLYNLFR
jgi:hypothetical protein